MSVRHCTKLRPLWQFLAGEGADPVLQLIPVCSYINSPTVCRALAMEGCQKHCPVILQWEQGAEVTAAKSREVNRKPEALADC